MDKRLLIAVAVAALATVQAAWAQPKPVTVTLVGDDIQVDQDPIFVERSMGKDVKIQWRVPANVDYSFHPTAITVEIQQDQLPPKCNGGPKVVTCNNRNTKLGKFKYAIHIIDKSGRQFDKDPIIVNR